MDPDISRIASAATTLDELTRQLAAIAEVYRGTEREDLTVELDEVERSLRAATRRLDRVVRRAV